MKKTKLVLLLLVALCLTIIDVSFFSNIEIYGATIISSFVVLAILAATESQDDCLALSLALVLCFAVFSSLPIWAIATNFFLLPLLLNFVRRRYFPKPTIFTIILYLLAANFAFDGLFLAYAREWSVAGYLTLSYFVVINTIAGGIIFALMERVKRNFFSQLQIKF